MAGWLRRSQSALDTDAGWKPDLHVTHERTHIDRRDAGFERRLRQIQLHVAESSPQFQAARYDAGEPALLA